MRKLGVNYSAKWGVPFAEFLKIIKMEKLMYDGKHTQFNEQVSAHIDELKMDYTKRRAMER